jgi:hypothetical protein
MAFSSCGGGVSVWQNKNPTAGFGSGVRKIQLRESEPDRHAAQQQRIKQQIQIQVTIHEATLATGAGGVNSILTRRGAIGRHRASERILRRSWSAAGSQTSRSR